MSLTSEAYSLIGDDIHNFENFGLSKLALLWPTEHQLALNNLLSEDPNCDPEDNFSLSILCEQMDTKNNSKFLSDLTIILATLNINDDQVYELIKEEKFAEAFPSLLYMAESGNFLAQHRVAKLFLDGSGVDLDNHKAFQWYLRAAEQDYIDSQYNLAMMYLDGDGTEKSYDKAYYWLRRGNRLGDEGCGEQMEVLNNEIINQEGNLNIIVCGRIYEDLSGALYDSIGDMTQEQFASMLLSLESNWDVYISEAYLIEKKEGSEKISPNILADVIPASLVYSFLADVHEFQKSFV